jgi:hypothetical protein
VVVMVVRKLNRGGYKLEKKKKLKEAIILKNEMRILSSSKLP